MCVCVSRSKTVILVDMLCCAAIGGRGTVSSTNDISYRRRASLSYREKKTGGSLCLIILFRRRVIKMRRVSSLNDLMNFRQALQIRPPGSLDRPNSVLLNEVYYHF